MHCVDSVSFHSNSRISAVHDGQNDRQVLSPLNQPSSDPLVGGQESPLVGATPHAVGAPGLPMRGSLPKQNGVPRCLRQRTRRQKNPASPAAKRARNGLLTSTLSVCKQRSARRGRPNITPKSLLGAALLTLLAPLTGRSVFLVRFGTARGLLICGQLVACS